MGKQTKNIEELMKILKSTDPIDDTWYDYVSDLVIPQIIDKMSNKEKINFLKTDFSKETYLFKQKLADIVSIFDMPEFSDNIYKLLIMDDNYDVHEFLNTMVKIQDYSIFEQKELNHITSLLKNTLNVIETMHNQANVIKQKLSKLK